MANALTRLLLSLVDSHKETIADPMDKVQLDAAQERLHHRSIQLDESVDQLSAMIKRLKRKQTRGKSE